MITKNDKWKPVPETDSADQMAAENNKQREWLSWQRPMTQVVNYDDASGTGQVTYLEEGPRMTTLQHQGGHHKVGGREEVQKLFREGLFRKSKTKQGGRVGKQPKWLHEKESLSQTARRPYVPAGAMIHDDNDAIFINLTKTFDTVFHEGL